MCANSGSKFTLTETVSGERLRADAHIALFRI